MARVFIVDDEPEVAKALRRMLARRGFEVEVAASAQEALTRLEAFSPDIVVSDHRMPGMTGSEFLDEVHRRLPSAARFLISGQPEPGSSAPEVGILAKPWDNDDLVARLLGALKGKPSLT